MTIIPCSNVTGNHKLKFSFIRKAKNLAPAALQFYLTTRRMHGWIQNFLTRFFNYFFPTGVRFLKLLYLQKKVFFVINNALSHPDDDDAQCSGDFRVIFLPPNVT